MIRFREAFIGSLCLHVTVFVSYWALSQYEPLVKLPTTSFQVKLAKLGEKRDENLLPRIDAAPPPPKPSKHGSKKAAQKENPLDLLKKRLGKPDKSGNPNGHKLGSSLSKEMADSYELQVVELLRQNYEIPRVISDREAAKLKLWVRIWISPKGDLLNIKIQEASKNPRFDQAVLTGSRRISSFGAPPLTLARKYKNEGLLIQFCPLECS